MCRAVCLREDRLVPEDTFYGSQDGDSIGQRDWLSHIWSAGPTQTMRRVGHAGTVSNRCARARGKLIGEGESLSAAQHSQGVGEHIARLCSRG